MSGIRRSLVLVAALATVTMLLLLLLSSKLTPSASTERAEKDLPGLKFREPLQVEKEVLHQGVSLTREYSFKMVKTNFLSRQDGLAVYLLPLIQFLRLPDVGLEEGLESIRCESAYKGLKKDCGLSIPGLIRRRMYHWGDGAGYSTYDLKVSFVDDIHLATSNMMRPSLHYPAYEKFETDVHVCSEKRSRETRLKQVPESVILHSCQEIPSLFPYVEIDKSKADTKIELTNSALWWVWKYVGESVTPSGAPYDFEITFTLQYYSLPCNPENIQKVAEMDNLPEEERVLPTAKSELSFRTFSSEHGSGRWYESVLQHVDSEFLALLEFLEEIELIGGEDRQCEED